MMTDYEAIDEGARGIALAIDAGAREIALAIDALTLAIEKHSRLTAFLAARQLYSSPEDADHHARIFLDDAEQLDK